MNRVLSTHLMANHRLTTATLSRVQQAGIPAVEIFCARQHLDYRNKAQVTEIGHFFRDAELKLHSVHSPIYNDEFWGRSGPQAVVSITEPNKAERIRMCDEIKRAIEIAEYAPFTYLIQHLGAPHEEFSERAIDTAFTSLEELMLFAGQRGVKILLENIPNGLSSAERLTHFLRVTHLDLHFVFDTGHANLMGGVEDEFEIMKERVRSLHVHDNDGQSDQHLIPLVSEGGSIDWKRFMPLLKARENQFPLLLELKEPPNVQHPIELANESFERLEDAG